MNITEVKVRKVFPTGRVKAIVSITLGEAVAVHDIMVIEGKERLYVAMPSRKIKGKFANIVHPINRKARYILEEAVITAYCAYVNAHDTEKPGTAVATAGHDTERSNA